MIFLDSLKKLLGVEGQPQLQAPQAPQPQPQPARPQNLSVQPHQANTQISVPAPPKPPVDMESLYAPGLKQLRSVRVPEYPELQYKEYDYLNYR